MSKDVSNTNPIANSRSILRIGFVGAGRMAQALANGVSNASGRPAGETNEAAVPKISFVDPVDQAAAKFQSICPHAIRCENVIQLASDCQMMVLAVKPQSMNSVLREIANTVPAEHLIVSVAAGISIDTIQRALGTDRIVRVMPNTPCLIGLGMSAVACGAGVSRLDRNSVVDDLLSTVGQVVQIDESQMDAVTGLSGSGPAYVFTFIEALIKSGIQQGLSPQVARLLTLQTVRGATEMVSTLESTPSELRDQVTSPGGTTLAGLEVLGKNEFNRIVAEAVAAAAKRSVELSKSP